MSPKSSSRKSVKASQRRRPPARHQPSSAVRLREPGLRAAYDAFIGPMRTLTDPAKVSNAFDAEGIASVLLGTVLRAGLVGDSLVNAMLDVVDELARGGLAHAYVTLRTLAVVGPPEITEPATRAADRMAPAADCAGSSTAWVAELGQVTSGACAMLADPYGETQTLLCEFAYADDAHAHGVLATIDAAWHGGLVALAIVDEPDLLRRQLARRARREDTIVREIPAFEAGQRLLAGIDAFLRYGCPPEMDRGDGVYRELCDSLSIAWHRARTLAGSADQPPAPDDVAARWPQDARQQIAAEFLASPHGRDLNGVFARKAPLLLIATCVAQLGRDPLLIGPLLLERMLLHIIPVTLTAPDRFGAEIPPAVRAWTSWLAERNDLPRRQRKQLQLKLDFLLRRFLVIWARGDNPMRRYVNDLPDEVVSDGPTMAAVLERRIFAVPRPTRRGDGLVQTRSGKRDRQVDDLDAADETDRQLITVLGVSSRGVAQQRFASYAAVAEQMWVNDPPDVWAAAERMQAAGYTREAILDRLAETWSREAAQDADGYAAALARLARPPSR